MATKTAACPECGAEAAPGRFACPECGALLATVGTPDGDRPPIARPAQRPPAGAYLSPSAVLSTPDPLPVAARWHDHQPADAPTRRLPRLSLAETLGTLGIADDVPRHLIASGSAVAALGFLLPWASVLAGNGLGGTYLTSWGLAGPGHWLIVLALLGLLGLAVASGRDRRVARLPLGPVAVVAAAILIGLLWPYLFGVFERFVGVWLVLAGTIVLAAGGLLGLRRHDPAGRAV